jgi:hypothetical protein
MPPLEDLGSEGDSSLRGRPGGAPSPPPLPLFPQSFIVDTVDLPPHRILR